MKINDFEKYSADKILDPAFLVSYLVRRGAFKVLDQCGGQTIDDVLLLGDNAHIPIRIGAGRGKISAANIDGVIIHRNGLGLNVDGRIWRIEMDIDAASLQGIEPIGKLAGIGHGKINRYAPLDCIDEGVLQNRAIKLLGFNIEGGAGSG